MALMLSSFKELLPMSLNGRLDQSISLKNTGELNQITILSVLDLIGYFRNHTTIVGYSISAVMELTETCMLFKFNVCFATRWKLYTMRKFYHHAKTYDRNSRGNVKTAHDKSRDPGKYAFSVLVLSNGFRFEHFMNLDIRIKNKDFINYYRLSLFSRWNSNNTNMHLFYYVK